MPFRYSNILMSNNKQLGCALSVSAQFKSNLTIYLQEPRFSLMDIYYLLPNQRTNSVIMYNKARKRSGHPFPICILTPYYCGGEAGNRKLMHVSDRQSCLTPGCRDLYRERHCLTVSSDTRMQRSL